MKQLPSSKYYLYNENKGNTKLHDRHTKNSVIPVLSTPNRRFTMEAKESLCPYKMNRGIRVLMLGN